MGFIDDAVNAVVEFVGDQISEALSTFFGKIMYYLTSALLYLLKVVYEFFAVFSGSSKIKYDGSENYLINIFFGNRSINNIYWGMALIGILFALVFAILAVIRKSFDLGDNHQKPISSILMNVGKSILGILLLSSVMSATLNITNLLIERVNFIFDNADSLDKKTEMTFTDEQFATMARIYNTIGNYSLNSSANSRFNLNSCYNAIRGDLISLQRDGVFDFYYSDKDAEGTFAPTWQSELQKIIEARDPRVEMKLDDKNTVTAIADIMEILKTNDAFYPLSEIRRVTNPSGAAISLDRIVFLMGTLDAAKDSYFNEEPMLTDAVRAPFYYGEKSIYSIGDVSNTFNIMISGISYLMIILITFFTLKNITVCIFNCIARIFNLLSLYIIAPPIFATMPIDDGAKFKQWVQTAVIQLFSIFGTIIPMRLVIMFIPMILDSKLVLFDSVTMNILAKALLIVGAVEAANRFSAILTGILSGNAGYAAIQSGDMRGVAANVFRGAAGIVGGAVTGTASAAVNLSGLGTAGRWAGDKLGKAADAVGGAINERGGILGATGYGIYRMFKGGGGSGGSGSPGSSGGSQTDSSGNKPLPENLRKGK